MVPNQVIEKLKAFGLQAEFVGGQGHRIIGGTKNSLTQGINVYENSFAIYRNSESWAVIISGPGQLDASSQHDTLEQAVDAAIGHYLRANAGSERAESDINGAGV